LREECILFSDDSEFQLFFMFISFY
jgi:hypothetical protein